MNSFLFESISDVYKKEKDSFYDICIVVPNKRSGIFIRKYLAELIDNHIFLPQIASINDLVKDTAGIAIADTFILVYKLYEVYKKHIETKETFDEFYYWGEMLLNDFDDIDKYYVDVKTFFANIESLKEIDDRFQYLTNEQIEAIRQFWGTLANDKLSGEQLSFHEIWSKLFAIYSDFTQQLKQECAGYEGLAYRIVADDIIAGNSTKFPKRKYAFLGFNALNECEHIIFKWLKLQQKAYFYWDADQYYLQDEVNEAGLFVKRNIEMHGMTNEFIPQYLPGNNAISIVSAPSSIAQIKHIPALLSDLIAQEKDISQCAIILCDESLLLPLLYSLPPTVTSVNITMGYPLKITPVFATIQALIRLQQNYSPKGFLYQDILSVFKDPLLNKLFDSNETDIVTTFKCHSYDRISNEVFLASSTTANIFTAVSTPLALLTYIQDIILQLSKLLQARQNNSVDVSINLECLFSSYNAVNVIKSQIAKIPDFDAMKLVTSLLLKALNTIKVSFAGEPLSGLQIMGILESRLLDFDDIIMVSANEGIMPSGKASASFIPYNLRQGFNLPTIKQQDAIYAYYFYRLLQRASDVTLMYSTQIADTSKGEMSRYISQIVYNDDFIKEYKNLIITLYPIEVIDDTIVKTPEAVSIITQKFMNDGKGLSPSALNTFIDCEVKFYYHYIADLKKEQEVIDLPNELEFGNLYHHAMQYLYESYVNKVVDSSVLQNIIDDESFIDECIFKAFAAVYSFSKSRNTIEGYKQIVFNVVKKYIINTLKSDVTRAPFTILGIEYKLDRVELPIIVRDENITVVFHGIIDRVDIKDEQVIITDYKTGKGNNKAKDIADLFNVDKDRNEKVFQTMFYAYLYQKKNGISLIKPQLYFVRESSQIVDSHIFIGDDIVNDFGKYFQEFEDGLLQIISSLLDTEKAFTRTSVKMKCDRCEYKLLCHR